MDLEGWLVHKTAPVRFLKETTMKLNFGSALGAAAILTLGASAYGEDTKATEKDTKEAASSSASTSKPGSQTKKKAGKRHQVRRGGGPVGDEGTRGQGQSTGAKPPELSSDTGLLPSTTQQKAGKEEQLERGAGPTGEEGTGKSGQSRNAPKPDNSPTKDTSTTPGSNASNPQK
jgi:hypothetical protein